MKVGVPKEIKVHEYRVGMAPAMAREFIAHGHRVLVESKAGVGIGYDDDAYRAVGANVVGDAEEVFASAELIVKVKEPQPAECRRLRPDQVLFTYLHLAADPEQVRLLSDSGCVAIAYETITDEAGGLPLLAPMSEVAGCMSIQVGALALQKPNGGRGVLPSGVPGTPPARVAIFGGGVVGTNAARMASGLRADVTVIDRSIERLRRVTDVLGSRIKTRYSTRDAVDELLHTSDLVVGAVLIPGAAAPKLVTRAQLADMQPGAVLVDVSIDQGGCFETSRPTTHADPTYVVDGIVHYCVANMPGAVPLTATTALNNATLPFALALADLGWQRACERDRHLAAGVNIRGGRITHPAVAEAMGMH